MKKRSAIAIRGRIPDTIYKILPYFYLCAGVLTISLGKNGMAVFSGIALITAGLLVWSARYQYRRNRQRERQHIVVKNVIKKDSDDTMRIKWRKSFESGHSVLDNQHHKLFALGNELINKVVNSESKSEIQMQLENIIKHTKEHFSTEEAVLDAMRHPISEIHKEIHGAMLSKLDQFYVLLQNDQLQQKELIGFIVYDLITDHLMKEDIQYFDGVKTRLDQA